ncbi:MAG: endo-1,4-beta-xylanase, partial [Lachnospiraceae bacterium]|nr:endo-1,4-beta-xylanase [Lachnospiraceae bacterium]
LKGHPLCWHTACVNWLMNYSNEEIIKKQVARINRDVGYFAGTIDMWDVINEVVIMPIFDKYDNAITRICKELGRVRTVKTMFDAARATNPDAKLLINDFNLSTNYQILIDGCLNSGVEIDEIGLQTHMHQGYMGKDRLMEILERFEVFGKPLHFTEITLTSGHIMPPEIDDLNDYKIDSWPSTPEFEDRQAKEFVEMYEILFAHPLVRTAYSWNFVDGGWLGAPAGILRADGSAKPVYDALYDLIRKQWWTDTEVVTDENGEATVEGFRGDYKLTCMGAETDLALRQGQLEGVKTFVI